jgi:hypothetical protein
MLGGLAVTEAAFASVTFWRGTQLHFSDPTAYNEIYSNSNRWDKEAGLYQSFGEDRSSFGFLTYAEAKQRKDIITPLFSRRAIFDLQDLIQSNVGTLPHRPIASVSFVAYPVYRLMDCAEPSRVTTRREILWPILRVPLLHHGHYHFLLFRQVRGSSGEPDFKAPIIEAMEASLPAFVIFRNFSIVRKAVFGMPPWLSAIVSPQTAGLIHLQQLLGAQVTEVVQDPESLQGAPHRIIYHELLSPEARKGAPLPSAGSLYEEAQALMFGGADTTGNTLILGTFYLLESPG